MFIVLSINFGSQTIISWKYPVNLVSNIKPKIWELAWIIVFGCWENEMKGKKKKIIGLEQVLIREHESLMGVFLLYNSIILFVI